MRRWLLAGLALLMVHAAHAAKLSSSGEAILLFGEIKSGDAEEFARILPQSGNTPHPVLFLNSPGGKVVEATQIGEMIRQRGIYTAVVDNSICASACSLIWAAGQARFADHTSKIGFHAAYTGEATESHTDGAGNARIGSYLARLGFSDRAIYFATSAPPDAINWLPTDGSIVDIPYKLIENPFQKSQSVGTSPAPSPPAKSAEAVATTRTQLRKPSNGDYLYPHELVASEPFKRAYAALFIGRSLPQWLAQYQTTLDGVETPVWSITTGTTTYQGFRVCQPRNCNDTWIDVVFADHRAYALTWQGGKPAEWWGQPDAALQQQILNEGNPAAAPPPMSASYDAGRQARIAYESWFAGLADGPFKEGAAFWAANRSLKHPPECRQQGNIVPTTDWDTGCNEAQTRLRPADLSRKTNPDFRWGWNSL